MPIEPTTPGQPPKDPFEPFGKALAKHHPRVRHVPYTAHNGITPYHEEHLQLASVIVFVISGPPDASQPSQVDLLQGVRSNRPDCPLVVVVCCKRLGLGLPDDFFPTLVEVEDYSTAHLERAADVLFEPRDWLGIMDDFGRVSLSEDGPGKDIEGRRRAHGVAATDVCPCGRVQRCQRRDQ